MQARNLVCAKTLNCRNEPGPPRLYSFRATTQGSYPCVRCSTYHGAQDKYEHWELLTLWPLGENSIHTAAGSLEDWSINKRLPWKDWKAELLN